jgi:hypothetical protein
MARITRMFFEHGLIRVIRVIRGQNRPRIFFRASGFVAASNS